MADIRSVLHEARETGVPEVVKAAEAALAALPAETPGVAAAIPPAVLELLKPVAIALLNAILKALQGQPVVMAGGSVQAGGALLAKLLALAAQLLPLILPLIA